MTYKMILRVAAIIAWLIPALSFAGIQNTSTQSIEIKYYADKEENGRLAADLMLYDPGFIAKKIKVPGLNEKTLTGISTGFGLNLATGEVFYTITYNLTNPNVSENIEELQKGFYDSFPKLIEYHLSKQKFIEEASPISLAWAKQFLSGDADALYAKCSPLLKSLVTSIQFSEISGKIKREFGTPKNISPAGSQYYEPYGVYPEHVVQTYMCRLLGQEKVAYQD